MTQKRSSIKKMKKQNSNRKRKFTFNAVDALIILLIVALIALTVYFFILGKDFSNPNDKETSVNTEQEETAVTSVVYYEINKETYTA